MGSDIYGGISELDMLRWVHDAVGIISTATQKVQRIVVLNIDDYRARLPNGFLAVVQAAYREEPKECCTREQVVKWVENTFDKHGCKIEISLVCPACSKIECSCDQSFVEVDANRIYQDAHPEQYYGYMKHFYAYGNTFSRGQGCVYTDEFQLMRRTVDAFYNIPYHIGDCVNFKVDSPVEYDISAGIDGGLFISTTFKKGEVLLSYMSEKTDEFGYRMVPDTPRCIEAVLHFLDERLAYRAWRKTGDSARYRDWIALEGLRDKKIARAVAELKLPDQDKFKNFLSTTWKQPIPFWHYDKSRNLHNPNVRDPGYYWPGVRRDYNFNY